ncbi:FmdB family zinc ribbon protein [Chloroflexota bacterium]
MPIYEYECTCCQSRFELKRSFSEDTPVFCPGCGGNAQRIFSPVPIIFKGPGFYCTDSGGNHGHPPSEGDAGKAKAGGTEKGG